MPGGRVLLASGSDDETVRLWDPATDNNELDRIYPVTATTALPGPDGQTLLASTSHDNTVRLANLQTGSRLGWQPVGRTDIVRAITALPVPSGPILAIGDGPTIQLRRIAQRTPRARFDYTPEDQGLNLEIAGQELTGHTGQVTSITAVPMPDGRLLVASGSNDMTVRLWEPLSGSSIGESLTGHTAAVNGLATLPMSAMQVLLASASDDMTVRLWDPLIGRQLGQPLTGHTGEVNAIAALTMWDERVLLATASNDGTVRLWDPHTGQTVGEPLTGHAGAVNTVAAVPTPDGRMLVASGGQDETLRLWDPVTRIPIRILRLGIRIHTLTTIDSTLAIGSDTGLIAIELTMRTQKQPSID